MNFSIYLNEFIINNYVFYKIFTDIYYKKIISVKTIFVFEIKFINLDII